MVSGFGTVGARVLSGWAGCGLEQRCKPDRIQPEILKAPNRRPVHGIVRQAHLKALCN